MRSVCVTQTDEQIKWQLLIVVLKGIVRRWSLACLNHVKMRIKLIIAVNMDRPFNTDLLSEHM